MCVISLHMEISAVQAGNRTSEVLLQDRGGLRVYSEERKLLMAIPIVDGVVFDAAAIEFPYPDSGTAGIDDAVSPNHDVRVDWRGPIRIGLVGGGDENRAGGDLRA